MFFADAAVRIPQADVDWAFYTQLRYPQRGVGFASCAAGFGWADGGPPRAWFPPTADKLPQGAVRVAASRAVFLPPHVLQEYWDEGFAEGRKVVEKEGGLDLLLLAARAARAARAGGDYTDLLVDGSVQGCTPSEDEGPAPKALLELLGKGKWTVRQAKGFPENWMAEWRGKERVPMVVVPPPGFGNVTSIAPVNSTHGP
ncbi:hypothetical protein DFJ74DRAFT_650609 [Hyaloraphidium curvatum]|nr:hypothetical protein DFJ74DRAFT_650609 [Hyaloraphidium curvatum]